MRPFGVCAVNDLQVQARQRLADWKASAEFVSRPDYSGGSVSSAAGPVPSNPWRHAGYGPSRDGWCTRPSVLRNSWTGETHQARCGSARPSKCPWCAEVKRLDIAAIGRSGWTDRPTDRGYWCALTAPGAAQLPFDVSQCTHSPGLRCSGKHFGCVVEADALARWHDGLPAHWMHFITALRRLLNPGLTGRPSSWPIQVEYFKTYEPQVRGALHAHFMLRVTGVCTDRRFQAAYKKAAEQNNFGPQMHCEQIDLSDSLAVAKKAGYCAKYSTKCADVLPTVRRLSASGELSHGGLRSWSASRHWGETMKLCKERRRNWATVGGSPAPAGGLGGASGGAALDSYQGIYAEQATVMHRSWSVASVIAG